MTATTPAADPIGDALISQFASIQTQLRDHVFPRLTVVSVVHGVGEPAVVLRCPRCGLLVDEHDLKAVDLDERHSKSQPIEDDDVAAQVVTFDGDVDTDYGDTLYFLHGAHAVSLPEGWTPEWL